MHAQLFGPMDALWIPFVCKISFLYGESLHRLLKTSDKGQESRHSHTCIQTGCMCVSKIIQQVGLKGKWQWYVSREI